MLGDIKILEGLYSKKVYSIKAIWKKVSRDGGLLPSKEGWITGRFIDKDSLLVAKGVEGKKEKAREG